MNDEGKGMNKPVKLIASAFAVLIAGTLPAFAHLDPGTHGSFAAGLSHPFFGLDHILAMVAVGLWATTLGGRAIWLVPATFVGTMAAGFLLALAGANLPFVEPAILASVVGLGLLVAAAVKLPVRIGMIVVGIFALFHGHAHGGEVGAVTYLDYGLGFAVATVLLHAAGVGLGLGAGRVLSGRSGALVTRAVGGVTALLGVGLVSGWI